MSFKSCDYSKHRDFAGEVAIHFPGHKDPYKQIVWVFPKLLSDWFQGTRNPRYRVTTITAKRARRLAAPTTSMFGITESFLRRDVV